MTSAETKAVIRARAQRVIAANLEATSSRDPPEQQLAKDVTGAANDVLVLMQILDRRDQEDVLSAQAQKLTLKADDVLVVRHPVHWSENQRHLVSLQAAQLAENFGCDWVLIPSDVTLETE